MSATALDLSISQDPPSPAELEHLYRQAEFIKNAEPGSMQAIVDSNSDWFTARSIDGELLGMGRLITDGARYGFIVDVIIEASQQRNGIGTLIMEAIIEHCCSLQLVSVNLWPSKGKKPFYEGLGFLPLGSDQPLMKFPPEALS